MQPRKYTVKRLADLYVVLEAARLREVQQARALLAEAEAAIAAQAAVGFDAILAGRSALAEADRTGWLFAKAQGDLIGLTRGRLNAVRAMRMEAKEGAVELHRASRVETEQMSSLLEQASKAAIVEERRHSQALSDDRFLSRQRWLKARNASWASGGDSNG